MRISRSRRSTLAILAAVLGACGEGVIDDDPGDDAPVDETVARAYAQLADHSAMAQVALGDRFVARASILDDTGQAHVRFHREHQGLRVFGGDVVVHGGADGSFAGVSLTMARPLTVATQPALPSTDAAALALAHEPGATALGSELMVYARGDVQALAWDVSLEARRPDGGPSRPHVIVDADSGAVLDRWDDVLTVAGLGRGYWVGDVTIDTLYTGADYRMQLPGPTWAWATHDGQHDDWTIDGPIFKDPDNIWGDRTPETRKTVGVDVFYGMQQTFSFFKQYGNHGITATSGPSTSIRTFANSGSNSGNAFWMTWCNCALFGDSAGIPLTTLDIVGHELAHAHNRYTADLAPSGESGGLNEANSDIFGTMVEFHAGNAADVPDWTIGERVFAKPLRFMAYPEKDGRSKGCWEPGVGALDVHHSSGVGNHFFYLLAKGTTDATHVCGTGLSFAGLGRETAARIWYDAVTHYMTAASEYRHARNATVQAATARYGAGSVQVTTVKKAWDAVKVP